MYTKELSFPADCHYKTVRTLIETSETFPDSIPCNIYFGRLLEAENESFGRESFHLLTLGNIFYIILHDTVCARIISSLFLGSKSDRKGR
jgi:hypothetical protein